MPSILDAERFHNELAALAHVEAMLWPNGPVCPHCGSVERLSRLAPQRTKPSKKHPEGKPVLGLWKCYACLGQFTVRIGTIFESSHAPLHIWLQAIHLMCSSKKGISTRQLQRTLGVSMKTAWFLGMRIREAMKPSGSAGPLGGAGKVVEVDETFLGRSPKTRRRAGRPMAILSLVERGASIRSAPLRGDYRSIEIMKAMQEHVDPASTAHTDSANYYKTLRMHVADHKKVDHSKKEWVRGDVHTNSLEGYFSIFKRGLVGVYQIMSEQHLHRYCHEFDFRYSNRIRLGIDDLKRAEIALKGTKGKRLTYQTTRGA